MKELVAKLKSLYGILYYKKFGDITLEDLGNSISAVLDGNVCVVNSDGSIMFLKKSNEQQFSNQSRIEELQKNSDGLIRYLVQLNTFQPNVAMAKPFVLLEEYEDKGLFTFFPIIAESKFVSTLIYWHGDTPITNEEIAICESACAMISMCVARSRARDARFQMMQKDAASVAANILSYSELQAVEELLKRMDGNECTIVISELADDIYIARSIISGALRKLEGSDIISVRSLGVKGTHIRINNPYIYSAVNQTNNMKNSFPSKPGQFNI